MELKIGFAMQWRLLTLFVSVGLSVKVTTAPGRSFRKLVLFVENAKGSKEKSKKQIKFELNEEIWEIYNFLRKIKLKIVLQWTIVVGISNSMALEYTEHIAKEDYGNDVQRAIT